MKRVNEILGASGLVLALALGGVRFGRVSTPAELGADQNAPDADRHGFGHHRVD